MTRRGPIRERASARMLGRAHVRRVRPGRDRRVRRGVDVAYPARVARVRAVIASLGSGAVTPTRVADFDPAARAPSKHQAKHEGQGYSVWVMAMRFAVWAQEQPTFPIAAQVMARFGCSKSSANRWLNALEDALGVERPRDLNQSNAPGIRRRTPVTKPTA